ncbi:MAG: DoxX family protein [Muribaculaceae bacterium]|nr:DoxX family protein [Muribaculaceae bacterium]
MTRHHVLHPLKKFLLRSTGYSYPNMGRLFLRLFVGIMLMQFGLRQLSGFAETADSFPAVLGMNSEWSLIVMITIEIVCSLCIMAGFLTRVSCVPPFVAMLIAEITLIAGNVDMTMMVQPWYQQNYLPIMFMGIFFFLFIVGPGKISVDYLISLRIIHAEDRNEDDELEII